MNGLSPIQPAVAAGVLELGLEPEALADPARRLGDRAVVVDTEVEDLEAGCALEPPTMARDAVGHVEIALALRAVAEDREAAWGRGGAAARSRSTWPCE